MRKGCICYCIERHHVAFSSLALSLALAVTEAYTMYHYTPAVSASGFKKANINIHFMQIVSRFSSYY